jgi:hypothetical protein
MQALHHKDAPIPGQHGSLTKLPDMACEDMTPEELALPTTLPRECGRLNSIDEMAAYDDLTEAEKWALLASQPAERTVHQSKPATFTETASFPRMSPGDGIGSDSTTQPT